MSADSFPRRVGLAAAALAIAASVAGCAGNDNNTNGLSTSESPTQGRPAGTSYGESFLVIVSPVNQDLAQLQSSLSSPGAAPSGTRLTQIVAPSLGDLQQADDTLSQIDWPSDAEGDVHAYLDADGSVAADLQALQQAGTGSTSADQTRLMRDLQTRDAAGRALRADIGVPR